MVDTARRSPRVQLRKQYDTASLNRAAQFRDAQIRTGEGHQVNIPELSPMQPVVADLARAGLPAASAPPAAAATSPAAAASPEYAASASSRLIEGDLARAGTTMDPAHNHRAKRQKTSDSSAASSHRRRRPPAGLAARLLAAGQPTSASSAESEPAAAAKRQRPSGWDPDRPLEQWAVGGLPFQKPGRVELRRQMEEAQEWMALSRRSREQALKLAALE